MSTSSAVARLKAFDPSRWAGALKAAGAVLAYIPMVAVAQAISQAAPVASAPAPAPTIVTTSNALGGVLEVLLGYASPVLAAMALVGAISMAIVQVLKTPGQTYFQRGAFQAWLGLGGFPFGKAPASPLLDEVLFLSIGQRKHMNVLCGLDLPKMMGQLQAAAKAALENPDQYSLFYTFLVSTDVKMGRRLEMTDVKVDLKEPTAPEPLPKSVQDANRPKDADLWAMRIDLKRLKVARERSLNAVGEERSPTQAEGDGLTDAQLHSRISNQVMRKLDGFQLRTAFWWETTCQVTAIAISVSIFYFALDRVNNVELTMPAKLIYGFLGGLLAPFIKDFAGTIKGLANRP